MRVREVAEIIAELRDPMKSPEEEQQKGNGSMMDASPCVNNKTPGSEKGTPAANAKAMAEEIRKKQVRTKSH